jgi:Holliday junction resolvase RusA-like endonuclease
MQPIWIYDLPLPPSVNEYLMPIAGPTKYSFNRGRRFQQARLVKTAIHKKYEQIVEYWINKNKESVTTLQKLISSEMNHNLKANKPFALKIDMYFVFEKSRILTKNNKAERLDRDNRIKPLQDQLSKIIGIDDKYIFSGNAEKLICSTKEEECSMIRISITQPRSKTQVISESYLDS